ncbi:hypothetical protein F4819DRAFT_470683 [Hypoxylon fuscum]|nr:hypothetical protein F4819DRAFT_470683 [Hypoxylon fuscum]
MSSASRAVWRWQARFFSTPQPSSQITPILRSRPRYPRTQRFQSTKPPPPPPSSSSAAEARKAQRADAILTRTSRWVPKRLHPYLARLRSAPFSHVAAFLVLHELTALLPLFGLAYLFHRADWVPTGWVLGPWAGWAEEGLRRYVRYFRKKGWFGLSADDEGDREGEQRLEERLREEMRREKEMGKGRGSWWAFWRREDGAADADATGPVNEGEGKSKSKAAWHTVKKAVTVDHTEKGYKIGIQIAAAYAITKMLLVPRIALSLWATPWLARGFVAARRSIWKKRN